ncbi:MAG: hypothetical protein U0797_24420 [Gemmataceae bacterium]
MTLTAFYRIVQSRWDSLSQKLWPRDVEQLCRAEIARLTDELEGRYARLVRRRRKIEQVRDRLAGLERADLGLAGEDSAVRAIERNRDRLAELEEGYDRQLRAFLRLKRLRRAIMRGQVVVCEDQPGSDD